MKMEVLKIKNLNLKLGNKFSTNRNLKYEILDCE